MEFYYVLFPFLSYVAGWQFNGQQIIYLTLSMFFLLAWAGVLLWRRLGEGLPWPKGGFIVFMFAFWLWLGLSLLWTSVPYTSWFYFWILGSLPLVFVLWQLVPEPDRVWAQFWSLLMFSTVLLSGWGLYQYVEQVLLAHSYLYRPMGPLLDYNSYAALLNLLFFAIFTRYVLLSRELAAGEDATRHKWIHAGYVFTLCLLLFANAVAVSRGGTLAWLLVVPFALWNLRRQPGFARKSIVIMSVALISFGIANSISTTSVTERFEPGFVKQDKSVGSRFLMWESDWRIYQDHPLLGTGLGTYFLYYPAYRDPKELESAGTYAHNDYIEFLQEGGPLNLLFLLGFVLGVTWLAYGLLRKRRDLAGIEATGLYLGVVCVGGHAIVNFIFYNLPIAFLAGLMAGRAYQMTRDSALTRPLLPVQIIRPMLSRVLLLLLLIWPASILFLDGFIALAFQANSPIVQQVARLRQQNEAQAQYELAKWLAVLRPMASTPHVVMASYDMAVLEKNPQASYATKLDLLKQALNSYQRALAGNPKQPGVLTAEAKILLRHPAFFGAKSAPMAENLLKKALAINPQYLEARLILAQTYFNRQDRRAGYAILKQGLQRPLFAQDRLSLRIAIVQVARQLGYDFEALDGLQSLLHDYPNNPRVLALKDKLFKPHH